MFRHTFYGGLLAVIAVSGIAEAEPLIRDFHQSFEVQSGVVLHLEHGDGDVIIQASDRDQIEVDVHYWYEIKNWSFGGTDRDFNVDFDQRGDHVYVREQITGGGVSIGIHASIRKDYTYTISVPAYTALRLEGEDGEVTIRDMNSELELTSDDGDIRIRDCSFELAEFRLEDGDLDVIRCAGSFEIDSEDGDIEFVDTAAVSLFIVAEDGDVDLDLVGNGPVDWEIRLDDGDVRIEMDPGLSADISLETDDGTLRVDLPDLDDMETRRNRLRGRLGDGEGMIRVQTEDGNITILERGGSG